MTTNGIVRINSELEKIIETFECPICLDDLKRTTRTQCGHRFCEVCIQTLMASDNKCPMCKKVIQANGLIHDFDYDRLMIELKDFKENYNRKLLRKSVTIKLIKKRIQLGELSLKLGNDHIDLLYEFIGKFAESQEDEVVRFERDLFIICVGPDRKYSFDEAENLFSVYKELNRVPEDVKIVPKRDIHLIRDLEIKQGSELLVFGTITFKSDMPKKCFKQTFVQGNTYKEDYYYCKTCNLKWICKNCREKCHFGHEMNKFSSKHNVDWACCYCAKNECHF